MLKFVFFLAAVGIVALIITGAITLGRTDDDTITIQINKARVRQDAAAAVRKGKQVLGGAESGIRQAAREVETN